MRIVIGVDWAEQAFTAVGTAFQLYTPQEVVLVHATDLRPFENPLFVPPVSKQTFEEFRRAMLDAGKEVLDKTAALVPIDGVSVRRVCEIGTPAAVLLDAAEATGADLVVVGARGLGRLHEWFLDSVSHRVLAHATRPTLIVKQPIPELQRVLLAMEGPEDAARLQRWLQHHPFQKPVQLTVISVVPTPHGMTPVAIPAFEPWGEVALQTSQALVDRVAGELTGTHYTAKGRAFSGDPLDVIVRESDTHDLLVLGSHGRSGFNRFLLGSVSHSAAHRARGSVLVVR